MKLKSLVTSVLLAIVTTTSHAQSTRAPATSPITNSLTDAMCDDARLADVTFVDPEHGWAVGDRGVIWHTRDGGKTWRLQNSGVEFPLTSVQFIDKLNGWAAGGQTDPWLHTSRGTVLRTRDSGKTWRPTGELLMPAIRRIKFFDARRGWALARHSESFPAGVFLTTDGGSTWAPVSGNQTASWQAADFFDSEHGAALGRDGLPKLFGRQGVSDSRSPSIGSRRVRSMRLEADGRGWLVGDRGLVLLTADRGLTWQTPAAELPEQIATLMELATIAGGGDHVWLAGTPGTRVLHSADAGRTWHVFNTGQSLPIEALHFTDTHRGWAVGALGTILATRDGGRTWQRQRGGGTRAAYAAIFAHADEVPLEVVAQLSADDGYYGVLQVIAAAETNKKHSDLIDDAARIHEAATSSGASAATLADTFGTKSRQLDLPVAKIVEHWDRTNDGQSLDRLEELLVRRIRIWRPDVVLTSGASPRGEDPLSHIVNQVTLRAVKSAADPTRFVEHTTHAGLESWQVKKVFTALPAGETGTVNISTSTLAARLEKSLAEYSARSRALVGNNTNTMRETLGFQLLVNRLPDAVGRRDFFSGIHLAHGQGARRRLVEATPESIAQLRKRAQLQRNLQRLFTADDQQPGDGERWLAQAGDISRELEPASAAAVLHRLAERYHKTGRWELAAETMRMIVDRYGHEPQAATAAEWLLVYYASSEAAWRSRGKHRFVVRQATAEVPAGTQQAARQTDFEGDAKSGAVLPETSANLFRRSGRAAALGTQLARVRPELFARPALRFPLAAAHRHQGYPRQSERYFQVLKLGGRSDAWAMCAETELWLNETKGVPPLPVWNCSRASGRPYLDGRLDDELWKTVSRVPLQLEDHRDQTTGVAMLAYDQEFLYFAATCTKASGVNYEVPKQKRTRDADLSGRDRIELLLDIDRDRGTYYRLAVDDRGFCHDSLWGDDTWNPKWSVARGGDDKTWVIEAAIAWNELVDSAPASKHVWAAQLQRITPAIGFQSWSTPASPEIQPEGFGLMVFE